MPRSLRVAMPLLLVLMIVTIAGALVVDDEAPVGSRNEEPAATPGSGDSPSVPGDYREGRPADFLPAFEPYDYADAAPPRAPTPVDGTYLRIVTIDAAGGPEHAIPIHCLRCVPYSVDAGVQTLTLFEGRYFLEHQLDGFRALGHYEIRGDRIELFNDANCSRVRGRYAWRLNGPDLRFDLIDDPCPFEDERSNDLTLAPWTAVDLCSSNVERWYPAFLGC